MQNFYMLIEFSVSNYRSFRELQTLSMVVLCEDSKSGKRYLEEAAFHFRAKAQVEIAYCGVTHPSGGLGNLKQIAAGCTGPNSLAKTLSLRVFPIVFVLQACGICALNVAL